MFAGALALVTAACSDDEEAGAEGETSSTASGGGDAAELADDDNEWALAYTGGTAGEATGEPYRVGYVSEDAFLPAATVGANAAAAFVNAELGGVAGRPLELVQCPVTTPEDAAQCGAQFANDDSISLVIVGAMNLGSRELYEAVGGHKAVLIGIGLTGEDFVTEHGVTYNSGSPGVLIGMGMFALEELGAESVAVVLPDAPSARVAIQQLLQPLFDGAGVEMRQTFFNPASTTPELQTALQATGADTADALITAFPPQNCISMYDATRALGIDPVVITTDQCASDPVRQHLRGLGEEHDIPNGWYFANFGFNYDVPDEESGMATYLANIEQYRDETPGSEDIETRGGMAGPVFATVMTAVQILNDVGLDADVATIDAALRSFRGPMMMQAGEQECGVPPFVAVCAHAMGVSQYVDGEWVSARDGLNGNPIIVG